MKNRLFAILIIFIGFAFGYADFANIYFPGWFLGGLSYKLGLDLQGGAHLVYRADTSQIPSGNIREAMAGLRDVIERRINFFGISEPVVRAAESSGENRLIVELAGVFDVNEAIGYIGETPYLEFKTERPPEERDKLIADIKSGDLLTPVDPIYQETGLTGRFLKNAKIDFDQISGKPYIVLNFNDEGAELFARLTKDNIGKRLAIYLDGAPISEPVVQDEITGGVAQITGQFTQSYSRDLVRKLNSGALPIPITLISQQSVGATLGNEALAKGVRASVYSIIAVAVFLIFWYRLPGLVGVFALAFYIALLLFIFKIGGVTFTAAGIAGFILSVGMAVDANVLIFERIKEEARRGNSSDLAVSKILDAALSNGFSRAWSSIRDASASTIITSAILFWFGTSVVKGFALTLGIGVFASLFSALFVSRIFLLVVGLRGHKFSRFIYSAGFTLK